MSYQTYDVVIHSAKGSTWKNHKYIKKFAGKYIYPTKEDIRERDEAQRELSKTEYELSVADTERRGAINNLSNESKYAERLRSNRDAAGFDSAKAMYDSEYTKSLARIAGLSVKVAGSSMKTLSGIKKRDQALQRLQKAETKINSTYGMKLLNTGMKIINGVHSKLKRGI